MCKLVKLSDLLWPRPHRACSVVADEGFITQTHALKLNVHTCLCDYISQSFTQKPYTHSVHVPAQQAIDSNISKCVVVVAGKT